MGEALVELLAKNPLLSLPRRVRFLAARHPPLASRLLDVFTRAAFAWKRRRARRLGAADPRTAASPPSSASATP